MDKKPEIIQHVQSLLKTAVIRNSQQRFVYIKILSALKQFEKPIVCADDLKSIKGIGPKTFESILQKCFAQTSIITVEDVDKKKASKKSEKHNLRKKTCENGKILTKFIEIPQSLNSTLGKEKTEKRIKNTRHKSDIECYSEHDKIINVHHGVDKNKYDKGSDEEKLIVSKAAKMTQNDISSRSKARYNEQVNIKDNQNIDKNAIDRFLSDAENVQITQKYINSNIKKQKFDLEYSSCKIKRKSEKLIINKDQGFRSKPCEFYDNTTDSKANTTKISKKSEKHCNTEITRPSCQYECREEDNVRAEDVFNDILLKNSITASKDTKYEDKMQYIRNTNTDGEVDFIINDKTCITAPKESQKHPSISKCDINAVNLNKKHRFCSNTPDISSPSQNKHQLLTNRSVSPLKDNESQICAKSTGLTPSKGMQNEQGNIKPKESSEVSNNRLSSEIKEQNSVSNYKSNAIIEENTRVKCLRKPAQTSFLETIVEIESRIRNQPSNVEFECTRLDRKGFEDRCHSPIMFMKPNFTRKSQAASTKGTVNRKTSPSSKSNLSYSSSHDVKESESAVGIQNAQNVNGICSPNFDNLADFQDNGFIAKGPCLKKKSSSVKSFSGSIPDTDEIIPFKDIEVSHKTNDDQVTTTVHQESSSFSYDNVKIESICPDDLIIMKSDTTKNTQNSKNRLVCSKEVECEKQTAEIRKSVQPVEKNSVKTKKQHQKTSNTNISSKDAPITIKSENTTVTTSLSSKRKNSTKETPQRRRREKGVLVKKKTETKLRDKPPLDYIPSYKSGAYAILKVLHSEDGLSKQIICHKGSPYSNTPLISNERKSAWLGIKQLIKKGLVTKDSKLYYLTDLGKSTCETIFSNESTIIEEDRSVLLVIDSREMKSKRDRSFFQRRFENSAQCETRVINLGDFIWLWGEYVMDYIVERKKGSDFVSSIIDGRFRDQKNRLLECGIRNIYYIIEGLTENCMLRYDRNKILKCLASLKRSRITVIETDDIEQTADFILQLDQAVKNSVKRALYCGDGGLTNMKYDYFMEKGSKKAIETPEDFLLLLFCSIRGLTEEKAAYLSNKYKTYANFYAEYISSENFEDKLAKTLTDSGPIGTNCAAKIINLLLTNS